MRYKSVIVAFLMSVGMMPAHAGTLGVGVRQTISETTGAVTKITVGDSPMNWVLLPDGQQYQWVTEKYGWGLGYLAVNGKSYCWSTPTAMNTDGTKVTYETGGIRIGVERKTSSDGEITERYTFSNTGRSTLSVTEAGIYTPFNDNYPDATTCLASRCHAHIWPGDEAAYVYAVRMDGTGNHLGLMVTDGAISGYEVMERGRDKASSHFRGVFSLRVPDFTLKSGESYSVEWLLFPHTGQQDFKEKLIGHGGMYIESDKYVYQKGETASLRIKSRKCPKGEIKTVVCDRLGDVSIPIVHKGVKTHVELLVVSDIEELVRRRAEFIVAHQRYNDKSNPLYGAFMVYDNEGDSIYLNNTPNCSRYDRNEGAERLGMGVFLAKYYKAHPSEELLTRLREYAAFVRTRLQTPEYKTFSCIDKSGRNRGYNYPWVADFYFHMYAITKDKQYAVDGYKTMKSWFQHFGYGFYAIDIPVAIGLESLKDAGLSLEHDTLLSDYKKNGDVFVSNSLKYPPHEVNYEQSIVGPAIQFLEELYLATGDKKYLDEVEKQLPVLEAFNGFQPSHHLNDIGIRHWDGYWFGKREMYGDTFPHYWSGITAVVFYYYAKITGNDDYLLRAKNIVNNNLSLFDEDGRGHCAYLYPDKIDGNKGKFNDPYANDQDWAMAYYMLINH